MKHGGGGRPGKGGRQVTKDEAELWRQLTHSVDKVNAKPRVATHDLGGDPGPAAPSEARHGLRRPAAPAPQAAAAPSAPRRVPQPPPPAEFDRRSLRQVAAGKVPIDDVLDLHGLHQAAAYARLRAFLVSSQARRLRMVLVITGKGGWTGAGGRPLAGEQYSFREPGGQGSDPATRGVLRRSVPLWLEEPELRAVVVGYSAAGARHGGDGALYVRLRKARDA
jgi:DNA-nicking Smr family endonuclease